MLHWPVWSIQILLNPSESAVRQSTTIKVKETTRQKVPCSAFASVHHPLSLRIQAQSLQYCEPCVFSCSRSVRPLVPSSGPSTLRNLGGTHTSSESCRCRRVCKLCSAPDATRAWWKRLGTGTRRASYRFWLGLRSRWPSTVSWCNEHDALEQSGNTMQFRQWLHAISILVFLS